MQQTVQEVCEQKFQEFMAKQKPYEISPDSPFYDVVKIFFIQGFAEGGKEGAMRLDELTRRDLEALFNGTK